MRILIPIFLTVILLAAPLGVIHAQGRPDSVSGLANETAYRLAVGIRASTLGERENTLSLMYLFSTQAALHLTAGRFVGGSRSPLAALFYERRHFLLRAARVRYLYGVGLNVSLPEVRDERRLADADLYAGGTLGVEYVLRFLPVSVGLDFRQLFNLIQASSSALLERHTLAATVHYYIK